MTMEQPPEHMPPSSEAAASPQGASRLDTLIGETLREQADGVTPAPDALSQLNARLDAAAPAPKWWALRPRLVGAFAAALILLVIFTPVGRLAAAGVQNATQTIITTVKEIATGSNDDRPKTQPGTPIVPSRANGSSTTLMPTNGIGSPGATGTIGGTGTTGTIGIGTPGPSGTPGAMTTATPTGTATQTPTVNIAPIASATTLPQRPTDTTGGTTPAPATPIRREGTPTPATEPASQVSTQTSNPSSAPSATSTSTTSPAAFTPATTTPAATATRTGTTTGTTTGSAPVATPPSRSGTTAPPTPTATVAP